MRVIRAMFKVAQAMLACGTRNGGSYCAFGEASNAREMEWGCGQKWLIGLQEVNLNGNAAITLFALGCSLFLWPVQPLSVWLTVCQSGVGLEMRSPGNLLQCGHVMLVVSSWCRAEYRVFCLLDSINLLAFGSFRSITNDICWNPNAGGTYMKEGTANIALAGSLGLVDGTYHAPVSGVYGVVEMVLQPRVLAQTTKGMDFEIGSLIMLMAGRPCSGMGQWSVAYYLCLARSFIEENYSVYAVLKTDWKYGPVCCGAAVLPGMSMA